MFKIGIRLMNGIIIVHFYYKYDGMNQMGQLIYKKRMASFGEI